jgi:hypothetical protein
MSNRPRLKSHAQPLRRGAGSLQLGLSPGAGVVLDGLSDAEIAVAERLDGTLDIPALYAAAAATGVAADRVSALIATLNEHRLLVDAASDRAWLCQVDGPQRHPLHPQSTATAIAAAYGLAGDGLDYVARRAAQHVVISGEGDLPAALADLLRAGGVGQVSVGVNALNTVDHELGGNLEPRGRSVNGRLPAALRPGPTSDVCPPASPDLVVLPVMGAVHADAGEPWLRRGIPHLPVVVQAHRVQVGPLISGRGLGPCLLCMDLHRRDRDAAWPAVLSQLSPTWPLSSGAPVTLESSLTALAVGVAAMIVHTCLDGQPVPVDVSLELALPWPAAISRRWFRHPLCQCSAGHATMAG